MAESMRCERCGGENPADARFCIDCGEALAPATTGPTTRLAGVPCPGCKSANPENARFCVVCGRGLVASTVSQPSPPPRPAIQQNFPRVDTRPAPIQMGPAAPPHRPAAHDPHIGALVFVGGLLVLLLTRSLWPGILLVIGISSLLGQSSRGRMDKGLMSLAWWGGLALLIAIGKFWPGILVLIFLSMMFSGGCRSHGRWRW